MNVYRKIISLLLASCLVGPAAFADSASAQDSVKSATRVGSLAERLGYPSDAKLVIIHADDIGVAHSVNDASLRAMSAGAVNSGSVMVPCPWFPEIAAATRDVTPALDLGLHLTLTSEWKHYRWDAVSPRHEVRSLHDARGFLHASSEDVAARADPREAEREIRAQVARAKELGLNPTHLDSHMGSLFQSKELFETYLRVARDNHIPAMIPREQLEQGAPQLLASLRPEDVVIDRIVMAPDTLAPGEWERFYTKAIETLRPGVTEIIVHLATDDEEMRAVTTAHPSYGSAWRQRDLDFFTGAKARQLLQKSGARLITWREIGKLIKK